MMLDVPAVYSGRFRADGHIIEASPELFALHCRCGGGNADPLAVPVLPSLIRRAASLNMPLSASVLLADGPRNITYWARAVPVNEAIDLQLFDWNADSAPLPQSLEQAVRERDFMRASSGWIWEVDADLCFTALSESASTVFEQPAVLLVGQSMAAVLRPFDGDDEGVDDFRIGSDPSVWFRDRVVQTRTKALPRYFRLSGMPVYDNDRLVSLRGTATETRRPQTTANPVGAGGASPIPVGAEEETAITDVLRAPLEQITQSAEAMRTQSFGHLKSVYAGYAGDIATAARHLRTLIDDVFDVAAIDSGTVALSIEKVDLTTLAEEARAIVSQRAAASGSQILWRAPPASVIVYADWGRTLQILINLMQNAVKFAGGAGPIQLILDVAEGEARLRVDDQGGGISPDDRERVFSKFERLQPHTAEGTGLGLYISRSLARAMGGDIALSISPEGGARFTLVLARA